MAIVLHLAVGHRMHVHVFAILGFLVMAGVPLTRRWFSLLSNLTIHNNTDW